MTERKRAIGSDLKKVDAHEITPEEYEEVPELTDAWFDNASLHEGGKAIRRGRPRADVTKEHVNLRLDRDVVEHFRAGGRGWQSRINATLRRAVKLDRPATRKRG